MYRNRIERFVWLLLAGVSNGWQFLSSKAGFVLRGDEGHERLQGQYPDTGYVLGMKTCACALECLVVMIQYKAPWPTIHKSFNFVCVCKCLE